MRVLHLLAIFAPFVAARLLSLKSVQETLMDSSATREKVPGNNQAYYTREKEADQLFDITEFIVTPSPPLR